MVKPQENLLKNLIIWLSAEDNHLSFYQICKICAKFQELAAKGWGIAFKYAILCKHKNENLWSVYSSCTKVYNLFTLIFTVWRCEYFKYTYLFKFVFVTGWCSH